MIGAVLLTALCAGASRAHASEPSRPVPVKPGLVLESEARRGDVIAALAIVDQRGVKLDPDAQQSLDGIELSLYIARPDPEAGSEKHIVYRGPLRVRIGRESTEFDAPTAPRSTPIRSIYRRVLPMGLDPGAIVILEPIPGWLDEPVSWRIPGPGASQPGPALVEVTLGASLFFAGLLALALALSRSRHPSREFGQ